MTGGVVFFLLVIGNVVCCDLGFGGWGFSVGEDGAWSGVGGSYVVVDVVFVLVVFGVRYGFPACVGGLHNFRIVDGVGVDVVDSVEG